MYVLIFHNTDRRLGEIPPQPGETLEFVGTLWVEPAVTPEEAAELAFVASSGLDDTKAGTEYDYWEVDSLGTSDLVVVVDNHPDDPEHHDFDIVPIVVEPTTETWSRVGLDQFTLAGVVVVDLTVDNTYELYEDVQVKVHGAILPAPPEDQNSDEYSEWAHSNVIDPFTGVGHEDGDSWYDVKVTASSDPALVGREFDFGY